MKEDLVSRLRGFFFYTDQSYLKYECTMGSFGFDLTSKDISEWKSTGIYNYSSRSNVNAFANAKSNLPNLKNDGRMQVYLSGKHFQQNVAGIPNNGNVIKIYCVYKLDPIASSRDDTYLELCKLLKILILQNIITKDMAYVLMKEGHLVIR